MPVKKFSKNSVVAFRISPEQKLKLQAIADGRPLSRFLQEAVTLFITEKFDGDKK